MSEKLTIARQFIEALPHARALDLRMEDFENGTAILSMPYDEKLVGDPRTGVVHGGAVFSLLDTSCGAAVMSHPHNPSHTATIDLRIEYLRAARPGDRIRATATCYHVTRSVAFVRASATDEDSENPVAIATGTFAIEGKE